MADNTTIKISSAEFRHPDGPVQARMFPGIHIVLADITGWTKLCYQAMRKAPRDGLADAIREFVNDALRVELWANTSPPSEDRGDGKGNDSSGEDREAYAVLANHTGDGFLFLCHKAETALLVGSLLQQCVTADFTGRLREAGISMPDDMAMRIAMHTGEVWGYAHTQHNAEVNCPQDVTLYDCKYYVSDAINLASRLITSDACHKLHSLCTREFHAKVPESRGVSYGDEYCLPGCEFGYPADVRVRAVNWPPIDKGT